MPAPAPLAGRSARTDALHPDVHLSFRDPRWDEARREARLYAQDCLRHLDLTDALAAFQAHYGPAPRWRAVFEGVRRTTR